METSVHVPDVVQLDNLGPRADQDLITSDCTALGLEPGFPTPSAALWLQRRAGIWLLFHFY